MGHDAHFLERLDRVTYEQTEVALALYRDHEAVRHILDEQAVAAEAPRIAISLNDRRRGPFVVVARDGHFVTCLGEGMSPGTLPVLPKDVLVRSLHFSDRMRHRRAQAAAIARPGDDIGALIARLGRRKNMLSREEISGIASFAPLFVDAVYRLAVSHAVALVRRTFVEKHPSPTAADHHARAVWACAYTMELCGAVPPRTLAPLLDMFGLFEDGPSDGPSFSAITTHLVDLPFMLRGAWTAGRIGPRLLRAYDGRIASATSAARVFDAVLAIGAIAVRGGIEAAPAPMIMPRSWKSLGEAPLPPFAPPLPEAVAILERWANGPWSRDGVARDPVRVYAAVCAQLALGTLANLDRSLNEALSYGAERYVAMTAGKLAPGDFGYAETAADVPKDLAITAYFAESGSIHDERLGKAAITHGLCSLALLGVAELEHFHFPGEILKKIETPWGEAEVARHYSQLRGALTPPATVRAVAKVPRNSACPCGSGKKAKRCCAA